MFSICRLSFLAVVGHEGSAEVLHSVTDLQFVMRLFSASNLTSFGRARSHEVEGIFFTSRRPLTH